MMFKAFILLKLIINCRVMNWNSQQLLEDGFSSEEQLKEDILTSESAMKIPPIIQEKKQLKLLIPPPQQIKEKAYSLQPDTITGWNPKIFFPKPVPTFFNNEYFDQILNFLIKATHDCSQTQLCYLGPRFHTSYFAWRNMNFPFPYNHLNQPREMKNTTRKFCGQYWLAEREDCLNFDSFFQSGNLDCVFKVQLIFQEVGQFEYDLFMRVDSNTKGHLHWFNFKIKNIIKGKTYRFHICNFRKSKSLYTRGMKPYAFSKKQYENQSKGWHMFGENVDYQRKSPKIFKLFNIQSQDNQTVKLSFSFTAEYDNDQIQIAYCVPYTYSELLRKIDDLQSKLMNADIISTNHLCISMGGLKVPILTITKDASEEQTAFKNKKLLKNKKVVFIIGRIHPGESNGSHMLNGFIDFICEDSRSAMQLRENIIFKIIPMMNPDGVAIGNYRTGLSGKDFNRQYIDPDKMLFPEVYELKHLLSKYKSLYKHNFMMFLDFHGHSIKKNVFAYGPDFPIITKNYYQCRIFPKLISKETDMFRYHSCSFKVSSGKEATARAVLIRDFAIPFTYTIEASNGFFYDQTKMVDVQFSGETWHQMGYKVGVAIYKYHKIIIELEEIKKRKAMAKETKMKEKRDKVKKMHSMNRGYSSVNSQHHIKKSAQFEQNVGRNSLKLQDQSPFLSLFQQIKRQSQKVKEQKCSDDEISEGKSDSQNETDDLSKEQMSVFIDMVKNNRHTQTPQNLYSSKPLKFIQEQTTFITEDFEPQKTFTRSPGKQKELIRMYRRKKLVSASGTPSPVKQKKSDQSSIAKIINFSFILNPITFKATTPMMESKGFEDKSRKIKTEVYDNEGESRSLYRRGDCSESFRKSFVTLQKQMNRRSQNQKKSSLKMYSSSKQALGIDEVVGKRIFTENNG